VHTIPRHDGVAHEDKVDVGEARNDLGVCGLRGDLGDLSVLSKEAVQRFLVEFDGVFAGLSRDEFDPDPILGEPVEVFEPGDTTDDASGYSCERVEPWFQGLFFEDLGELGCFIISASLLT